MNQFIHFHAIRLFTSIIMTQKRSYETKKRLDAPKEMKTKMRMPKKCFVYTINLQISFRIDNASRYGA